MNKPDSAPPEVLPIFAWLVSTVALLAVAFLQADRVGFTPTGEVVRTGTATIKNCSADLSTFGTMKRCKADVEWRPRREWKANRIRTLNDGDNAVITSRSTLDGEVEVETHPTFTVIGNETTTETIIPAGQPSGRSGIWWVLLAIPPILASYLILRFITMPWIRRRKGESAA